MGIDINENLTYFSIKINLSIFENVDIKHKNKVSKSIEP